MQVDLGKSLLYAAQHLLIPLDLQVRMKAALHQYTRAADFHRLADLLVDGLKIQYISLGAPRPFHRRVESAEGAIFSAEIGVVDVAVNDVTDHAFRVQLS